MKHEDLHFQRLEVNLLLYDQKINNALEIIESWVQAISDYTIKQSHLLEIETIKSNYYYVFQYFLTFDDNNREDILDELTRKTYDLSDAVYVDVLTSLHFVQVPFERMPKNDNDILFYLSNKLRLSRYDYTAIRRIMNDMNGLRLAAVISGLAINAKRNFSVDLLKHLIDFQNTDNPVAQNMSLVLTIFILAFYDDRIDYYPELQDAFEDQLDKIDRSVAFEVLMTFFAILEGDNSMFDLFVQGGKSKGFDDDDVPHELLTSPLKMDKPIKFVLEHILDTWVAECIIDEEPERIEEVEKKAICIGQISYFSGSVEEAEKVVLKRLRGEQAKPYDYVNYAHCCLIRNDRAMAVEYYKKARKMCGSYREFCNIFEKGIPFLFNKDVSASTVELIEDQMRNDDL